MTPIYHLTTDEGWAAAQALGEYHHASLRTEGFIHASTAGQLAGSANRFFEGHASVLVLVIDPSRVGVPIVAEHSTHSPEPFPHLYGPLSLDAVVAVRPWARGDDGRFALVDLGPLPPQDGPGRSASVRPRPDP